MVWELGGTRREREVSRRRVNWMCKRKERRKKTNQVWPGKRNRDGCGYK